MSVAPVRPSAKLLIVGGVITVTSILLGYVAGASVKSPQQVLADTAPPPATILTEKVVRMKVTRSVSFDGFVEHRHQTSIIVPAALEGGATGIVTRLPAAVGQRIDSGDVVAEVSGRPVIVLRGQLPAYRSLAPGDEGPDVEQLQRALIENGHLVGAPDGVYGNATAAAVAALYADHGYRAEVVGLEEVAVAEASVRAAQRAFDRIKVGDGLGLRFAEQDLDAANAVLAEKRAVSGARVNQGEIVFLPALPAEVATLTTEVGSESGALMVVSSGPLVVRGSPQSVDGGQIRVGARARLLLTPGGERNGRVRGSRLTESSTDENGEGDTAVVRSYEVVPDKSLHKRRAGTPVRIVVVVESSPRVRLTIPISAITVTADGRDAVTVVRGDTEKVVEVTPGFAGDGRVQVDPVTPGSLSIGDRVAVGTMS